MHSEGILAGELKHGPLALIDRQMPVIMVIMKDPCFAKCQNALQQITARQVRALCQSRLLSPPRFHMHSPHPLRPPPSLAPLMNGVHVPRGTGWLPAMHATAPE